MPDYMPVTLPGQVYTMTTSGAVTGGDLLIVSGSGTVAKAGADASPSYVGVALQDAASGAKVTVQTRGPIHSSLADGTVTAGDQVGTTATANRAVKTIAAAGAAYAQTAANAGRAVLGVALTTASDNALVRWMSF
jgi:Uncharacterized conserved protein (DUF2190)